MNVLLRKIDIRSDNEINILNETIETTFFGRTKKVETITKEKAVYSYWIEFHIDQGRFYYGETKPVLVPNRKDVYVYQTSTSHTKRGLDKSLEIITEIKQRTELIHPNWEIELHQISNMPFYRQFDREKNLSDYY